MQACLLLCARVCMCAQIHPWFCQSLAAVPFTLLTTGDTRCHWVPIYLHFKYTAKSLIPYTQPLTFFHFSMRVCLPVHTCVFQYFVFCISVFCHWGWEWILIQILSTNTFFPHSQPPKHHDLEKDKLALEIQQHLWSLPWISKKLNAGNCMLNCILKCEPQELPTIKKASIL